MFSSRFHWDLQPNPLTKLLRAKREAGAKVLDLTESNPTSAGIHYPATEILSSLADPRSLLKGASAHTSTALTSREIGT